MQMPMVKVHYRTGVVGWMLAQELGEVLPQIVADALSSEDPGGKLVATDVEVEVMAMGPGLRTAYDLHIEVEANASFERQRTLEERTRKIVNAVRVFFYKTERWKSAPPPRGWIWVKLLPAHFAEL